MTLPTHGLTAVSVTPLNTDGTVDHDSITTLMNFYVDAGVSGVALLGVMGEANRMTESEARSVAAESISALAGRVPALVGVSDSSFERLVSTSRAAMDLGAAGVLVQPATGLVGDDAVAGWFETVSRALGPSIPICVQDFPRASGVHISLAAWHKIVEKCPSVVMLKHEDEPGLDKLTGIRVAERAGLRPVTITVGNNGVSLPYELARGADGAMTGFAYPDALSRVCALHDEGRFADAQSLFDEHLPLNVYELRGGVGVRKEILRLRGALATSVCRSPVKPLSAATRSEIALLMDRVSAVTTAKAVT